MLARETGLAELLRIEVCQGEVSASFRGIALQDLFEFFHGIQREPGLLEGKSKVVAGIDRVGFDGERDFVGGEGLFPAPKVVGSEAEIIVSVEVCGVRVDGLLIIAQGLIVLVRFLGSDSAGKMSLRVPAIARPGKLRRGITVTRVTGRGRRRRKCRNVRVRDRGRPHFGRGRICLGRLRSTTKRVEPREKAALLLTSFVGGLIRSRRGAGNGALGVCLRGLSRRRDFLRRFDDEVLLELSHRHVRRFLRAIGWRGWSAGDGRRIGRRRSRS